MEFLSIIASLTNRRPILSTRETDAVKLPPFRQRDVLNGKLAVFAETGDPASPTEIVPVDGSGGIGLTDGKGVIYAEATAIAVQNQNEIMFTLAVNSPALTSAFSATADDSIDAFFEARVTQGAQDEMLLREAVTIQTAAL